MKKILTCVGFLVILGFPAFLSGQGVSHTPAFLRMGFYNAENYFDPYPDTTCQYNEFTPSGARHWTVQRYRTKRQHIFKVITAMGGWHGVDVMAFAEIENRFVLEDLLKSTPLKTENYGIIHYESPDHRGIDVGLIYRRNRFYPLYSKAIHVTGPSGTSLKTRDILYVKALAGADTLHLFINHWPSRYGGLMATVSKRILVAKILKHVIDSVCRHVPDAFILVMGDFNETLSDKGIQLLLQQRDSCQMRALSPHFDNGRARGTIFGKTGWEIFDRVLCSKNMLAPHAPLFVIDESFHIFDAPFLLENDKNNMGWRPNRTYTGFTWHGGFSDHLPVYVDIRIRKTVTP